MTDEHTVIIWLKFGNPTLNYGRFRECFRRFRHRWITHHIDSRTVEGTNLAQIARWAEDYGDESDFFKVRVRGLFPNMSAKQFIGGTQDSLRQLLTVVQAHLAARRALLAASMASTSSSSSPLPPPARAASNFAAASSRLAMIAAKVSGLT